MAWKEDSLSRPRATSGKAGGAGASGSRAGVRTSVRTVVDAGLRNHMLRVYNFMASGLALTGIVSLVTVQSPYLMSLLFESGLMWVLLFAQLGMVIFLSMRINRMKSSTAQAVFWVYAATMGLTLSPIVMLYTGASVARVFFITAGTFAAMSIYGYTTKRDLHGIGMFLYMGLIGIIIAMVVNFFLQSSAVMLVISMIGVVIFTGLTAYDTQVIKDMYRESDGTQTAQNKAVIGALKLYLDFINLFIMLLRLLGERR